MRPRRLTIRSSLTVLYGAAFLVSGVGLLTAVYLQVAHALPEAHTVDSYGVPFVKGSEAYTKNQLFAQQRDDVLHRLVVGSALALSVSLLVAGVLGWILARRVLRPLRIITATTQGISEENLHQRLALPGRQDEVKELGDTIDGLLARLESAFDAQRSFVANASHELRTPLTLTRATLQVALADPNITVDSLRAACDEALDAGRHQEQLIDALLTLARSQHGLDHREPVELTAIAARVATAHQAAAANLAVRLDTALQTASVLGDAQLMERMISNLAHNAVHYNHPGGIVHVATGVDEHTAWISVTNTGPLVAPDQIARLLQPFQRNSGERVHRDHEGLGLGLAIVQAICTAHDAQLTVRALPSGGLVVEVRFPRATGN